VDWVDYEQRNRQADFQAYGRRLSQTAGEHVVWLVSNPDYRTYEGQCEGLARTLTALRGQPLCLVERDNFYFEHADLRGWGPQRNGQVEDVQVTGQSRDLLSCPAADVPARRRAER
jgi:mannosyltransferase